MILLLGLSLAIPLVINLGLFFVAFKWQSDKLTDFAYSLSFIATSITAFVLSSHKSFAASLAIGLVLVWALRLGIFLVWRIRKKGNDNRFDDMRASFFRFLKFWLGQAVVAWILLLPVLFLLSRPSEISVLFLVGVVVWLAGFVIESIADYQKFRFSLDPKNHGQWIDEGLWHRSRHPNYFGEISIWLGVYLFSLASLPLFEQLVGLISPLVIFISLRFISGVPILEKSANRRWGSDPKYQKYRQTTPLLIPIKF